jgi:cell division protein FtsB
MNFEPLIIALLSTIAIVAGSYFAFKGTKATADNTLMIEFLRTKIETLQADLQKMKDENYSLKEQMKRCLTCKNSELK